MEQLPNDLLLTVMEYLGTEDLFACRLVCKKLGALALHPGVWRRQHCSSGRAGTGAKAVCRVLRLAPRLNKLTLRLKGRSHHVSYDRTKCAVRELELTVNPSSAVLATLMIRNQEALGRLRRVALTLHDVVKAETAETGALCLTLATSSVLKKLEINCFSPRLPFVDGLSCKVHTPSLEYFQCSFELASENFINFVLAGHASTLKVVDLEDRECMTARSSSTASLLAGVAHLQQLTCPLLPSMEDLAASASLTNLTLYVSSAMKQVAPAAADFLRRARHLRDVTLCYTSNDRYPADVGVDLIGALAGTGQNGVQVLNIENSVWPDDDDGEGGGERVPYPYLEPLARALPFMPALSSLSVDVFGVPEELLEAISPDTTPALDTLRLTPEGPDRGGDGDQPECAHGWRHEDSVEKFLALNPKIKLSIHCERMSCYSEKSKCQSCKQGCHMQHYRNSKRFCWARMFPDSELSSSNVQ